jgi:AhpD family alkylhydroperoxidase
MQWRTTIIRRLSHKRSITESLPKRGLVDSAMMSSTSFRNDSGFTPAEQEVVFLTISHENGCEYCMAAHSVVGEKMSGVPAPVLNALRSGLPLPDSKLQALSVFTRVMVASRGKPTRQDLQAFLAAAFSERQVLEIILAIAVKTISNYSNHVFHTDVDAVFAAYRWETPKAA